MKKLLLAALLALAGCSEPAHAQNPTCPTRPYGDSSNACASTAFVQGNSGPINVRAFGAKGDGTTDDAPAWRAAITAACGTSGVPPAGRAVYASAGFYRFASKVTAACGLKVYGDGWPQDSGALATNQFITTTAALNGTIILPDAGVSALEFTTNQAVELQDFAVVYLPRATAGSGVVGILIQAAAAATSPATIAWNEGTKLDRIWVFGADINIAMVNAGHYAIQNTHVWAHQTTGIRHTGPNIPYEGSWRIGPNNVFSTGSSVNCQHVLATSSGGGHVNNNTFWSCGSANVIPPAETSAIAIIPTLNTADPNDNSQEPIVITGNTMEGLSNCILFDGSTVGQNASLTQFVITGNQMWCIRPIDMRATSTSTSWISGGVISGNSLTATTLNPTPTTTFNIRIAGAQNIAVTGNSFGLFRAQGGDTSTPISLGTAASLVCQSGNQRVDSVGVDAVSVTIPLCLEGSSTGQIIIGQSSGLPVWKTMSGDCTIVAAGTITCAGAYTGVGNTNYTILSTDRTVVTTTSFSTTRTWTLPAANSVLNGVTIRVYDMAGAISGANALTVQRAGADTISGQTNFTTNLQFDSLDFISNGTNAWAVNRALSGVAASACGSATQTCVVTPDLFGRVRTATSTTMTSLNGVAYPSSYTSGGIPYASGTNTIASSAALAANQLVLGGGAGTAPATLGSLGTTTTVLHGNAAGAPTFGAVNLAADVTGDLPFANLTQGSALSVLGVTGNATADFASIAAGSDHQVLRRSGTALTFGAVNLAQSAAVTGTLAVGNGGTGITSFGTGVATWLGTPSSANLAAAVTDETGSGALVFGTSPTLATPTLTGTVPLSAGGGFSNNGQNQIASLGTNQSLGYMKVNALSGNMDFGMNGTTAFVSNNSSSTINMSVSGGAATADVVGGTYTAATYLSVGTKIRAAGSAPALSSCGTTPAIVGSDLAGTVTMGTASPTGCVITFNAAYAAAPHCVVTWQANLASMQYTVSTTAITLTQTATSSNLVNYICMARSGG